MSIAAVYARVSTSDQKEEGNSLETQIDAGVNKARELGLTVPSDFVVQEDWTGTDLTRKGLMRLFQMGEAGAIVAVIIFTLDRLYRPENDGDEWKIFQIIERFERAGVEVIWVDPSIPAGGPLAPIFAFLDSWRSGRERRGILERTRRGRLAVARKGGLLGGFTAFGYNYVPKSHGNLATLEINESEARIVKEMYRWLINERASCRYIAEHLNELHIPSPTGLKVWHPGVVNHMLRSETYCGVYYFNARRPAKAENPRSDSRRSKSQKSSRKMNPRVEWIAIDVPAIIDRQTWDRAQKQLESNSIYSPRNSNRIYFLKGHVKCGTCGASYTGFTAKRRGKEYQYYICANRYPRDGQIRCSGRNLSLSVLDDVVWDVVEMAIQDPDALLQDHGNRTGQGNTDVEPEYIQRLKSDLRKLESSEDRLLDIYTDGRIEREKLDTRIDQITAQRQFLNIQIDAIHDSAAEQDNLNSAMENFQNYCDAIRSGLSNLTGEERQEILRLLVERVTINEDIVRIELAIPFNPKLVYSLRTTHPPPSPPNPNIGIRGASSVSEVASDSVFPMPSGSNITTPPPGSTFKITSRNAGFGTSPTTDLLFGSNRTASSIDDSIWLRCFTSA